MKHKNLDLSAELIIGWIGHHKENYSKPDISSVNNNNNNNNNNNGLITLQKLIGSSMLHKYLNNYNVYITITIM